MTSITPSPSRPRPQLMPLGASASGSSAHIAPDQSVSLALGQTLGGRYRVDGFVGQGGMGKVYRATDLRLERVVVVKVAHGGADQSAEEVARFRREALKMAALKHPNVVAIYDYDQSEGLDFLVMECVDGYMLKEELRARGPLSAERFVTVTTQLLAGLDAAHRRGVIHRDIKPSNLMWDTESSLLKILDFGLARGVEGDTLTSTGHAHGSVQYMAPEQIRGDAQDPRTDVYAVGVLLFLLITGEQPFSGENTVELMFHKLQRPAPPLLSRLPPSASWVSPALAALVDSCLSIEPAERPHSAGDCAARCAPLFALISLEGAQQLAARSSVAMPASGDVERASQPTRLASLAPPAPPAPHPASPELAARSPRPLSAALSSALSAALSSAISSALSARAPLIALIVLIAVAIGALITWALIPSPPSAPPRVTLQPLEVSRPAPDELPSAPSPSPEPPTAAPLAPQLSAPPAPIADQPRPLPLHTSAPQAPTEEPPSPRAAERGDEPKGSSAGGVSRKPTDAVRGSKKRGASFKSSRRSGGKGGKQGAKQGGKQGAKQGGKPKTGTEVPFLD